ncbi:hypothetical protein [Streptomyces sp. NPDC003710]
MSFGTTKVRLSERKGRYEFLYGFPSPLNALRTTSSSPKTAPPRHRRTTCSSKVRSATQPSITPQYDPDHPPWQRLIAYTMTIENVAVFRTACEWLNDGNVQQALLAAAYGGRTVPRAGHEA